MNQPHRVVQDIVEDGSTHRFLIAAWGGRDEHRLEAIRVANRMYRDGKTIGIVFGPDQDTHMIPRWAHPTIELEAYANGQMAITERAKIGGAVLHKIGGEFADSMYESYDLNHPNR